MRYLTIGFACLSLAACGSSATVLPDAGIPDSAAADDAMADAASSGDSATLPIPTNAIITTASMSSGTGALNTVTLAAEHQVTPAIDTTLDSDTDVRCLGGKCYLLNRTHGTLRIYDPTTWQNTVEIKTGNTDAPHGFSNPHEAYPIPSSTKVYLALTGNDAAHAIGIIDTTQPEAGVIGWIAIPLATADTDGKPEVNNLHYCNGLIYATVEDLDENNWFTPTGPSRIVVIDPATDTLDANPIIQLQGYNPFNWGVEGSGCDRMLVANAANQFGALDGTGGIERVDLTARASLGVIATDMHLGGHPAAVVVASSTVAFALINYQLNTAYLSKVVKFNPSSTGDTVSDVTLPASYIAFIKFAPPSQLFVGVTFGDTSKGQLAPGVYIGPADGTAIGPPLLDLGQAPYAMSVY